jgi:hypothetical protein
MELSLKVLLQRRQGSSVVAVMIPDRGPRADRACPRSIPAAASGNVRQIKERVAALPQEVENCRATTRPSSGRG